MTNEDEQEQAEDRTYRPSRRYAVITAVDLGTLIQRVNDARDNRRAIPIGGIAFDHDGNPCQAMIV